MKDFDARWNYSDPAATELVFKEAWNNRNREDADYELQLTTQIARTYSLQRKFDEAHQLLNTINRADLKQYPIAEIRYYLERGRTFNSSGKKQEAMDAFHSAASIALQHNADFYYVDALHMLGIADSTDASLQWNVKAIEIAEASKDERAKNWLGSLYNNTGWTWFDLKEYEKAKALFTKCFIWNKNKNRVEASRIAQYSIAKCLRMQEKNDEAMTILHQLEQEKDDGYVFEELAENYLAIKKETQAASYFKKTHQALSDDIWLNANEPERIKRWTSFF